MVIDPQLATEFWEDRKLVGFWDTVFFGKVKSDGVYSDAYPYPTKTFDVEVLESLKGEAAGTVQVNQPADVTKQGDPIHFEHAGVPLVNGQAYVFVGAKDPAQGLYLVHTTYQQVDVSVPAGSTKEEILQSYHAGELRVRFQDAIENEIPFDPTSSDDERREQREKAIAAKDPSLLPLCTEEDFTNRPDPVPAKSTEPWDYPDQLGCRLPPAKPDQIVVGPASQPGPMGVPSDLTATPP